MFASGSTSNAKKEEIKREIKDYYPEEMIEFAKENMKFVLRIEKILEAVIKEKTYKTLPDIDPGKKGFVSTLMNKNYALE